MQRLKLEQADLMSLFTSIVISGQLGYGKPDPRVFTLALHELECDPTEVITVGDSWERDVLGALRAGIRAVWVAAGRAPPHTHPEVSVIRSVTELHTVLESTPP